MTRCRFVVLIQNDMTGGDERRCVLDAGHEGDHLATAPEHLWYEPYQPDDGRVSPDA